MAEIDLVKILVDDAINRAINHYEIEGAIQVIESVYNCNSKLKKVMLENIKQRLRND